MFFRLCPMDLSSPTRDQTLIPCSGSTESKPLDHQGSFHASFLNIYLLAVLGLCYYTDFSPVAASRGYSLVVVCRLLIAVHSLVAEHRL